MTRFGQKNKGTEKSVFGLRKADQLQQPNRAFFCPFIFLSSFFSSHFHFLLAIRGPFRRPQVVGLAACQETGGWKHESSNRERNNENFSHACRPDVRPYPAADISGRRGDGLCRPGPRVAAARRRPRARGRTDGRWQSARQPSALCAAFYT